MSEGFTTKRKNSEPQSSNKRPRIGDKSLKRNREQQDSTRPTKLCKTMKSSGGLSTSGKSQPKKLTVSFKARPTLPVNYEEETWATLQLAIRAVQNKQGISTTQEELYRSVENLVDHKMSEKLYSNLQLECEHHVQSMCQTLLRELEKTSPEAFLGIIHACWNDHCQEMILIRSFFMCLDRKYALQNNDTKSIWDMGLSLFCDHICSMPDIASKMRTGLLKLIENDRKGDDVDKILIKNLLRMLSALGLYTSQFEKYFLDASSIFYKNESDQNIQELQTAEFLRRLENRIDEEGQRVIQYLDQSTRRPLIQRIEQVALAAHVETILEKGYDELADKNSVEDLKRLYSLFLRVDATQKLKTFWNAHIKKRGIALITDQQKDKTMIEELLQFKENSDNILKLAFQSNNDFLYSQKEAFEHFINHRQNAPAEFLAKYVDTKLRIGKENRASTENELEVIMDKTMQLFRYINGKDVFEAFYKKDLAKRLLLNKSSSIDAEKAMIQKLKVECGANFTSKLEGMFKDMDSSAQIVQVFKESKQYLEWGNQFDTKIFILTTGFWPPYAQLKCVIPNELDKFCKVFESFYLDKHNSRRLQWQHNLGQCMLKALFPKGIKELSVSLYQAAVLLLFNDQEKWSFQQIQEHTQLEQNELKRTLMSLATTTLRVLNKTESKNNEIVVDDIFTFRSEFVSKARRIKINAVQIKDTPQETKKTQENVFKERQYQVDAALVRIMKTRKTLTQAQLTSELVSHLRFPVKMPHLNKRIDSLVEREFLERDEADTNTLHYVA